MRRFLFRAGVGLLGVISPLSQMGMAAPQTPAPATAPATAPADAQLDAAEAMVGRALFLRGFYLWDDLSYDAGGHILGTPKTGEWTLAGMDVKKVARRGREIQLDGVRVIIRYNAESHQFERHPQNQEPLRVRVLADEGAVKSLAAALDAIFAQGIDPRLQQATPPFWQHFFNPAAAWPSDALSHETIVAVTGPSAAGALTPPVATHQEELKPTLYAERDKVRGTVLLRLTVDTDGVPRRVELVQPLGYGLDAQAAESVMRWRFTPAKRAGKAIAATLLVNLEFEPPARR